MSGHGTLSIALHICTSYIEQALASLLEVKLSILGMKVLGFFYSGNPLSQTNENFFQARDPVIFAESVIITF